MVQDVVIAAYHWLLRLASYGWQLMPYLILGSLAAAALVLAWRRLDPEGAAAAGASLQKRSRTIWSLLSLGLVVAAFAAALVQSSKVVEVRRETVSEADASRTNDPNLSGVTQYAPSLGIIEEKTYTRTMTLPPDFLNRVNVEGVQILSPYLSDPSAEGVTKLADTFRRSGADVVFTREVTRKDESPVPADAANVQADFKSIGGDSGRRHFEASVSAEYKFRNPRDEAAQMRFVFPLPEGGGIVQGFTVRSGSKTVTEPDDHGQYAWLDTVPAGSQVTVQVEYRVTGAGGYDYVLGSERRRIGDFTFTAHSDRDPKFGRRGIFPTSLGSNSAEWKLKDVLTSQAISLVFPRADINAELLDKTLSLLPALLVLFAAGALWVNPSRALFACCSVGVAFLSIPTLASYASAPVATAIGAVLAFGCAGLIFRERRGWVLGGLVGLLALAFLTAEHGMLVAWLIAAAIVAGTVMTFWRRGQAVANGASLR